MAAIVNGMSLSKLRPDLIMVQLSGSPDGSNAVDYTVNCAAGFPGVTGSGRDGPVNHVLPAWDLVTGKMAALGLLASGQVDGGSLITHRYPVEDALAAFDQAGSGQALKVALCND